MFNVGDRIIAIGNYRDEQLGEFAPTSVQVVTEVKNNAPTKSGQWVKTNMENDWIDCAWFKLEDDHTTPIYPKRCDCGASKDPIKYGPTHLHDCPALGH